MNNKTKITATEEEARSALVPKLRFPEFRNNAEWRVKKLKELLFETKTRNRTLELGPTDVLSVSGEHGCVNQIEFMGRSYAGVSVKDYHVVEHGDVVYTKSPLKKNPFGIIKENKGKRGIVSTLYAVYRPFHNCSATYLDHFFSKDYNVNAYLQPIVKKGAKNDMKVNNADVLEGDISVPDLPEQQKIAQCLSSMDELLTAQARQVDALKIHKKGLMQQLFPCEGETQPRLRFPEFQNAGNWNEARLGDHVDIQSGASPSDFTLSSKGKFAFVKVEDLNNCMKYQVSGREFCDDSAGLVPTNSILFPKRGAAIELNKIRITATQILIDTNLMALTPKHGLKAEFLYYYLSNVGLSHIADTSTIPQINNKHIMPLKVLLPLETEQRRIASCLTSLDALINLEFQKLEALKRHKKGLMQQLFPSSAEVQV